VLLVDDNSTSLKVLTETLLSLNFKVSSVESGAKAVDKLMRARKPYDLVLLDWRMPKLDGISTAKLIRQKLSLKKMPLIILMSAYGKDLVDKDSQELQLDGILVKPITPSSLFNAIIQAKNNVKREAPRNEAEVTAKKSIQALSGHIILAEDNMINQQVAVEILHQMGVEVSVCENGLEVLKQLQQQTPDLILMDIQMPEMDGYETTQKIREQQKFEHLPIIAMTANAMKDDIHKSLQAGMQGHISKPVDPALLYQTLSEYLGFAQNQARKPQKQPEDDEEFQPWPESVAGLNIKLGIKQVGGNEKLYQKLLKDFLHNHEHLAKDMKKMLNSSDPSQATRAAHTLKGVSANIGAERLHRISSDIDNRLKNELTIDNSILQEFSKACDELCGSIHQLIAPTAEREKPGASSAPINKIELDNLLQGLRIGDAESRNNVQKLSTSLESLLGKEKFEQLTQLIQDYEFEAAADILSTAQFEDVNDD
jgi:CheY-like chemotaxis protein/HPt (histidine-containing phosphotransfer) domain-containing protein